MAAKKPAGNHGVDWSNQMRRNVIASKNMEASKDVKGEQTQKKRR